MRSCLTRRAIKHSSVGIRRRTQVGKFSNLGIIRGCDSLKEEFVNKYLKPKVPCIFPKEFNNWVACSEWVVGDFETNHTHLNRDYFLDLVGRHIEENGENNVPQCYVEIGSFENELNKGEFQRVRIPFPLFVRLFTESDKYKDMYLAQSNLLEDLPELLADVDPFPRYLPNSPSSIYGSSVWIGRKSLTPKHRDPDDNIHIVVSGVKTFTLYSPDQGRPSQSTSNFDLENRGFKPWDTVTLGPGDGIFIPRRWWHQVESPDRDRTTISVNWWFR